MKCRINPRSICACVVSTCLILWTLSARAAPVSQYTLTDLGATASPMALAPTTNMTVGVQDVDTTPNQHPVAYILAPHVLNLSTLPQGSFSTAQGVSEDGATVIGFSSTGPLGLWTHAARWTAASGMVDLGTMGSANLLSAARGINSVGTLVGYADSPDQTTLVPVVWTESTLSRLPTLDGGNAFAVAINEAGAIVGNARTPEGQTHCVLWPVAGGITDCHTADSTFSMALGINEVGQVTGYANTADGQRGYVWLPLTGMLFLSPLKEDTESAAYAINDAGVVVGRSALPHPDVATQLLHEAATRWDNGTPTDLNTLITVPGWSLQTAVGVNNRGEIVGTGMFNGQRHGFLLTPVERCEEGREEE
jgi:probable HAF family extracellular repeat protein